MIGNVNVGIHWGGRTAHCSANKLFPERIIKVFGSPTSIVETWSIRVVPRIRTYVYIVYYYLDPMELLVVEASLLTSRVPSTGAGPNFHQ
jgi:hypothetical protein